LQHLQLLKRQEEILIGEQEKLEQMRAIHMPQHQNIQFTPPYPMPTNDNIMTTTENNNNNNNNYENDE
jgi:hypothetical protein